MALSKQDRERDHEEGGVEGQQRERVLLPAHLGRLAMAEQPEQAHAGRRRSPCRPAPARGRACGPSTSRAAASPRSAGRSPRTDAPATKSNEELPVSRGLESFGQNHDITQIDQGGHGQHAGQVEHREVLSVQRWSQAATRAKNRPKIAGPERVLRATSCEIAVIFLRAGPARETNRGGCGTIRWRFLFLELRADRGATAASAEPGVVSEDLAEHGSRPR